MEIPQKKMGLTPKRMFFFFSWKIRHQEMDEKWGVTLFQETSIEPSFIEVFEHQIGGISFNCQQ